MVKLYANPTQTFGEVQGNDVSSGMFSDDSSLRNTLGLEEGLRVDGVTPDDGLTPKTDLWVYDQDVANNIVRGPNFGSGVRGDAGAFDGLLPHNALVHMHKRVIKEKFAPYMSEKLFRINREGGWKDYIERRQEQSNGTAAKICCADDFRRVSISGKTLRTPIITIGSGFNLCYSDMQKGKEAGIDIGARLLATAIRAIEQLLNNLAFFGDTNSGILGIQNNPLLGWADAGFAFDDFRIDPLLILNVLNKMSASARIQSSGAYEASDTLALPMDLYQTLSDRRISVYNGQTILEALKSTGRIKKVIEVPQFSCLAPGGGRMGMFFKDSPECVELSRPGEIVIMDPIKNGWGYSVNVYARVSSLWFNYPSEVTRFTA